MAVTYPLRGANATVQSWGSANFYSTLLAAMKPASMRFQFVNDGPDTTGIGEFAHSEIPGLIGGSFTIGGFAGSTPYLGVYASIAASGGTTPYLSDVQSITLTLASRVDDATTGSAGSPATYTSPMPSGAFMATATWRCLVDQNTALVKPDVRGATLNNLVFTYGSSQTLAFATGNIKRLNVEVVRSQKQLVTYQATSVGTITPAGSLLGSTAFSNSAPFPLWSGAAGSTQGAMVAYLNGAADRTITLADSFATSITINATPAAPVGVEVSGVSVGTITIA